MFGCAGGLARGGTVSRLIRLALARGLSGYALHLRDIESGPAIVEIVVNLYCKPRFRVTADGRFKTQSHFRRHRALARHDIVERLTRNAERLGEGRLDTQEQNRYK